MFKKTTKGFVVIVLCMTNSLIGYCTAWKAYEKAGDFKIKYPADWAVELFLGEKESFQISPLAAEAKFKLTLRHEKRPSAWLAASLNEFADQVCISALKQISGTEILEKWTAKIDGKDSVTVLYTVIDQFAVKTRFKAYIFFDENFYYWLTYGGKDNVFEEYSQTAGSIIGSFQVLSKFAIKQ